MPAMKSPQVAIKTQHSQINKEILFLKRQVHLHCCPTIISIHPKHFRRPKLKLPSSQTEIHATPHGGPQRSHTSFLPTWGSQAPRCPQGQSHQGEALLAQTVIPESRFLPKASPASRIHGLPRLCSHHTLPSSGSG